MSSFLVDQICVLSLLKVERSNSLDYHQDLVIRTRKKKSVNEQGLNTINLNEFENEINKEYNNFALMIDEEVLGNFLVESPEELNMVLEESRDISPFKLSDSPPIMLDIHHVKGLE
jgi:hypothetical protein